MKAEEPDEEKVGALDDLKRMKRSCLSQMIFVFFLIRYYCVSCYMEFENVTVLQNYQLDFPVDEKLRHHYLKKCGKDGSALLAMLTNMGMDTFESAHKVIEDTKEEHPITRRNNTSSFRTAAEKAMKEQKIREDLKNDDLEDKVKLEKELCHPQLSEIMEVCQTLPFGASIPRLKFRIPFSITVALPCVSQTCSSLMALRHLNVFIVCFILAWTISFCTLRTCFDLRLTTYRELIEHD